MLACLFPVLFRKSFKRSKEEQKICMRVDSSTTSASFLSPPSTPRFRKFGTPELRVRVAFLYRQASNRIWRRVHDSKKQKTRGEKKISGKLDSPVHEDATAAVKGALNETVGGRKMLEQVFIVDVVDLYDHVLLEWREQGIVERQAQDREHMGDVCGLQGVPSAQGEEAADFEDID